MHALYVEKRPEHNQPSQTLLADLRETLQLPQLRGLRILQRYFVDSLSDEHFAQASELILSEPFTESTFSDLPTAEHSFAIEFLPGQFDQRADSAAQCIAILSGEEAPPLTSAQVYLLEGELSEAQLDTIKSYLINPVDSHEAALEIPATLTPPSKEPADVAILDDFRTQSESALGELQSELGLAMTLDDLTHTQSYFRDEEKRDPSLTEIKLLDTYWSDHCRHTTFLTKVEEVTFGENTATIEATYRNYQKTREALYGADTERPETMMDLAIIAAKELKKSGELDNLEISEEINAASIIVEVEIDRGSENSETVTEEYLIQFKNETHNHPTEIEPFGGAATCLGGCIRDPLSGRAYVYQAMRVTGAWDPRTSFSDTLPNKLPQRKICLEAARGYSSYGNQIGLATGQVSEIYHPGYLAKRMEVGAVVAACPRSQVQRGNPEPGDIILLIGGRTGRDGVGGATGSSKEHTETALENSAEVQKGNPPTERKVQRLFRNPELSYKIKRCNDFGAGGVSVAIGELADSLDIDLDKVPKKYQGLDGTELAISESQERMAVVVDPADVDYFIAESDKENLECVQVATVTDSGRLNMTWRGQTIVSLTRDFIDTNGVQQSASIHIQSPQETDKKNSEDLLGQLSSLNLASQKGLGEMFDSSIGAGTVLSPFGGKNQITPPDAMVAKVPILDGESDACTHMSWAFDAELSSASPFHGSVHAVAESVCKLVATGARLSDTRLTFQEYFPKLGDDPARWGLPFAALLGAFHAQQGLRLAAIGGKDSMSGSFKDLDVPPTLVSFALAPGKASQAVSPEFKRADSTLSLISAPVDEEGLPIYKELISVANQIHEQIDAGKISSVKYVGQGGLGYALATSCLGNDIGAVTAHDAPLESAPYSFLVEHSEQLPATFQRIGNTTTETELVITSETLNPISLSLDEITAAYTSPLESVYKTTTPQAPSSPLEVNVAAVSQDFQRKAPTLLTQQPKVTIPVFPGTNCEYDTAAAFAQAGANPETLVFRNLSPEAISESLDALAASIRESQILMLPGGFSSGDEPDGSAKFIATILRNPAIADAIADLHQTRQGLILGICNGFQALVKSGLLTPAGSATLSHNPIARHISTYVTTRISNNNSPWLANCAVGDLHSIPVSHGEGRFLADEATLASLVANGQIATQYCELDGTPSMVEPANPNQSALAIEGITSPCGRIFGKMGHTERRGQNVAKNILGEKHQPLFKAGVSYFQ